MGNILKNFALFIVGGGFLVLPLPLFTTIGYWISIAGMGGIISGYVIAAYYHKRNIHTHHFTWIIGLPLLTLVYALILLYFVISLWVVVIAVILFMLHLILLPLFAGLTRAK